jgi:integrase
MILATTALRISEVASLQVGDVDLLRGLLTVRRQTSPGRGGLATKETKGRQRHPMPIIEPLRATLERLTVGRARDARLLVGPRGGVNTTATLHDATRWDELVDDLGLAGVVRHGLRHTALTWMADAGVELHLLQRVAGHQDPGGDEPLASPGSPGRPRCRGGVLALVGPIWAQLPGVEASRGWAPAG